MKTCSFCGAQIPDESKFCIKCGKPVPQFIVCPHCGAKVPSGYSYCGACGKKIVEESNPKGTEQPKPNPIVNQIQQKGMKVPHKHKENNKPLYVLAVATVLSTLVLIIVGAVYFMSRSEESEAQDALARQDYSEEKEAQNTLVRENRSEKPATKEYTVNGVSFKMVRVAGGTFQMGATSEQGNDAEDREKPVHSVTLSDYYIGETEVTQALWQAVMGSNPSHFKGNSQRPVECVSWDDCKTFIRKLNELTGMSFRLPTEAEWEFAARGGNSQGYKYSGSNTIGDVAWYDGNSSDKTHPVGTKVPNEFGLYDMTGNVWEWCQDWYSDYSSSSQTNPKGPSSGSCRVLRGGSWNYGARYCRVSVRCDGTPSYRYGRGLRLAL